VTRWPFSFQAKAGVETTMTTRNASTFFMTVPGRTGSLEAPTAAATIPNA
jgi:hypothetical protein